MNFVSQSSRWRQSSQRENSIRLDGGLVGRDTITDGSRAFVFMTSQYGGGLITTPLERRTLEPTFSLEAEHWVVVLLLLDTLFWGFAVSWLWLFSKWSVFWLLPTSGAEWELDVHALCDVNEICPSLFDTSGVDCLLCPSVLASTS